MKILIIGSVMRDVFIEYKKQQNTILKTPRGPCSFLLLEEGSKQEVDDLVYACGGGAFNTSISFSRLDFAVSTFFKIGNDPEGAAIIQRLKQNNIQQYGITSKKLGTGSSFIIPSPTGNRTALVYRGANITLTEDELPLEAIKNVDYIYLTSLSGKTSSLLLPIVKHAKKNNHYVATNPGTSQLLGGADTLCKALPYIDTLILNRYETTLLMNSLVKNNKNILKTDLLLSKDGPPLLQNVLQYNNITFSLRQYFQAVFALGTKITIVTNDKDGVYVATKETIYYLPSLKVKVVSTVGAGDAFGSCFVASLLHGKSIEQSLIRGIINSASVISYLNTTDGLLDENELQKRENKIGAKDITIYKQN